MRHIHVIGAGVVGLATALRLQQEGHKVALIDRNGPGEMASRGNAAGIAWTDVAPLASKGIWRKIPGWLLDPLGPLSVRPAYALKILPWMLRFSRASLPDKLKHSVLGKAAINKASLPAWERLWQSSGTRHHVFMKGCLEVYTERSQIEGVRKGWQEQREHGIEVEELNGDQIRELESDFSENVVGGALVPGWMSVDDPHALCLSLAEAFERNGGKILKSSVSHVQPQGDHIVLHLEGEEQILSDHAVIACGAWSKTLAAQLGDKVPLETERGYNTTFSEPNVALKHAVMVPGLGFAVTQLSHGLRVGGAVEFGGLEMEANWKRADAMAEKASRLLPGLNRENGIRWMGHRPSMPDTLPVIGHSKQSDRVTYAFGHGHHGLTQAAITAELVSDLICGETPKIDCTLYSAQRF
ncbi:D-amino acid dehydrogenase small subunit [Pseudovibrio sp. W64]|uniref:NAD(P)/FAD-dependent oxidoreductase n=1 Tax=Pseudovibrio sp. W64 TaxID=1735583 RepID=UPI0007AEC9F2|nr:FAD-dependent oxidoreductase [Pseudovibrio sp. W64]KZK77330.1 D-amino acid dehydrogenase small subunit [Pseudovibrio sp. W64]